MSWTSTRSSHWEMFHEINLNLKTLKLCTSWEHWKNQCRSTARKQVLLWNNHEYQHSADICLKYLQLISCIWSFPTSFPDVFRGHWKRPVLTQLGNKAQKWDAQKCEDTMLLDPLLQWQITVGLGLILDKL